MNKIFDMDTVEAQQNETRRLIKEAAAVANRPVPWASHQWRDIHERLHIAPWPEERKHEPHGIDCWCGPSLYRGVLFHWDE